MRAANAFGWDVLSATDMNFRQKDAGNWTLEDPVDFESDWTYAPESEEEGADDGEGEPIVQRNAWFWDENQVLPHVISRDVYPEISNQVKVSTFLFLKTDPNELLYFSDIPNLTRPFRVFSAIADTDWYPASYPWHCVLELDRSREHICIEKGTPLCRLFTVRRESYFAREMSATDFGAFFQQSQEWLQRYGKGERSEMTDITGRYGKQQQLSRFTVLP